jgi:hypothetical protein
VGQNLGHLRFDRRINGHDDTLAEQLAQQVGGACANRFGKGPKGDRHLHGHLPLARFRGPFDLLLLGTTCLARLIVVEKEDFAVANVLFTANLTAFLPFIAARITTNDLTGLSGISFRIAGLTPPC